MDTVAFVFLYVRHLVAVDALRTGEIFTYTLVEAFDPSEVSARATDVLLAIARIVVGGPNVGSVIVERAPEGLLNKYLFTRGIEKTLGFEIAIDHLNRLAREVAYAYSEGEIEEVFGDDFEGDDDPDALFGP